MASQDTSVPAADGSAAAKPTYDYTAGSFAAPLAKSEMDRRSLTLAYGPEWVFMSGLHSVRAMYVPMTLPNRRQSFGVDAQRRYNLFCVQEKTLMFAVGNILHSLNTETGEKTYFQGFRGGSIGAIAIHPSGKFLAIGEKAVDNPNVYVLHYPSLDIHRVLRDGTLRSYASLCFNKSGDRLATVGADPDYMLTVWDWTTETIILRSKAFSQDVYLISFHSEMDGILTTSGMGHIKFWKMARTFTGLKLQGAVGKFGLSELSDITSFVHLPDGKVLSGTESGIMLLWEGGAIKCELAIKGEGVCHKGAIDVLMLDDNEVMTGGDDGYVRLWDLESIDCADLSQAPPNCRVYELEPQDEILVSKDAKIKTIVRAKGSSSEYFVQDASGHIYKLDTKKRTSDKVYSFSAGGVTAIEASPVLPRFAVLSGDGSLRLMDYINNRALGRVRFSAAGTCGQYLPVAVDPSGSTYAAGYADGVVRILKHSAINAGQVNFSLLFAFKPHSQPITSLSVSPCGRFIITGAEDTNLFFFQILPRGSQANAADIVQNASVDYSIRPLGFVGLSGVPVAVNWTTLDSDRSSSNDLNSKTRRKFMVVLRSGALYEATTPSVEDLDTETSYQLHARELSLREFHFDVNDDIARAEALGEAACKALAEEEAKKEEELRGDSEPAPAIVLDKSQWKIVFARKGGVGAGLNVVAVLLFDRDHCLVSLEAENGEGQLRVCNIANPKVSRLIYRGATPITSLRLSHSGKYLIYGTQNGGVFFQTFSPALYYIPSNWTHGHQDCIAPKVILPSQASAFNVAPMHESGQFWKCHAHDCDRGAVRGVSCSFDDSHYFTAGQDGSVFVWRVAANQPQQSVYGDKDLAVVDGKLKAGSDISDAATYSIQEAKIKTERNREAQEAEERKMKARKEVTAVKEKFAASLRDWKQSPAFNEEMRWKLNVNQGLSEQYEKDLEERLEVLRKEAAWITERDTIAVDKLKKKFVDNVATERIVVDACVTGHSVATFRTSKLVQAAEKHIGVSSAEERNDMPGAALVDEKPTAALHNFDNTESAKKTTSEEKKKAAAALSKIEARKQQRAERAEQLKDLIKSKPDDSYEDPSDIAAIRTAESKMGDYKLKSSPKYIVPEHERVNTEKKKRQFHLLKDSIQLLKEQFNGFVVQLRERKVRLVQDVGEWSKQVASINNELRQLGVDVPDSVWRPQIGDAAFPENRYIVTDRDVAKYQRQEAERQARLKAGDEDPLGGFNANRGKAIRDAALAAAADSNSEDPVTDAGGVGFVASMPSIAMNTPYCVAIVDHQDVDLKAGVRTVNGHSVGLSDLERSQLNARVTILQYRKVRLNKKIEAAVKLFDQDVDRLATERLLLEGDMKFAEMKLLLVFREWVLLKDYENLDAELTSKLNAKIHEKKDIDLRLKECQDKLDIRRDEVESIIAREKVIKEEFNNTIGENNKHEEFLTKLFQRKIRRSRKKSKAAASGQQANDADADEQDYSDSDNDDDNSLASSDAEESFVETCPFGCDKALYAAVLELREKRLDEEDRLNDIQKIIDILKKEYDAHLKKERTMDASLRQIENEIQEFHAMKQKKFNELEVCIPLRPHQIQFLDGNGRISTEMSNAVVFLSSGLHHLRGRISDLQQEKADIRKQHNQLKKMHVNLVKNRKEKQLKLGELENRLYEVQMLKFGRVVDLERLEKLGLNKAADEMRDKLNKEDQQRNKQLQTWDNQIMELREEYNNILIRNTELLEGLVEKRKARKQMESTLNVKQSAVTVEFSGTKTQDDLDLERLEALAREQKEEIKALEREIDFLSHKPGAKTPAPKFGGNTASTVVDSKTEENAPAPSPPYRYPTTRSANVEGLLVETRRGTGVQSDGVAHGLSPSPASARSPFHATDAAGTPSLSMGATSLGAALASVGKRDGHLLSKPSTTLSVKKSAPATAVDIKLEGHRPESSHRPESTASRRG